MVFLAYLIHYHFTSCLLLCSCAHVYLLPDLPVELYVIFNHPMIVDSDSSEYYSEAWALP